MLIKFGFSGTGNPLRSNQESVMRFTWFIIKESLRNEQIVEAQVRLIGPEGEQLGMVSGAEANAKAREYGLDLVMIAPDAKPPVCKIRDYGKHKFDQLKKLKDQKKAQKTAKLKEMSLSMTIGDHDLQTKANQVSKFLQDGSKVKVNIRMSGRQMARPQQGIEIMTKFADILKEFGTMDKKPEVTGRNIFMYLIPIKK